MAQKISSDFPVPQKMNPKLFLCSTKPCMICTSLSHPPNTHPSSFSIHSLAHSSSFPLDSLIVLQQSQVHSLSQSLSTSCSLCLETPVHMLSPFSLQKSQAFSDHQFDILYTYVYVYSFIFSQENVSCMKKELCLIY